MTGTISAVLPSSMELGEIVEQVWMSFLGGEFFVIPGDDTAEADQAGKMVASVSISGDWAGHLMVVADQHCAEQIASEMFQMDAAEITTAEVADALGEIANMVGGSVKGMVGVAATLSLPQVVLDAAALVNPDAHQLVSVSARWNGLPVEVSLWERSSSSRSAGLVEGK